MLPAWPLLGVAACKTLLLILVEPLAPQIKPPTPEGEEMGFSIPELLTKLGGNEICENGLTLQCKQEILKKTQIYI